MATFAYDPDWSPSATIGKRVLVSQSVSGARRSRVKEGMKRTFTLQFTDRDAAEYDAVVTFWDAHYPDTQFTYSDKSFATPRSVTCIFVSDITHTYHAYNVRDYSFTIEEVV